MKKLLLLITIPFLLMNCTKKEKEETNPLLAEWKTPFQTPPFSKITESDYMYAFQKAIQENKAEIDAIVNNPEEPTFENTLLALDKSGATLNRVANVFYNKLSADATDTLQILAKEISPLMSELSDDINLNPKLFARVKSVYEQRASLDLTTEESRYLEETYKGFVRGGANLHADKQERFREINKELSLASLQYADNLLAETNAFTVVIDDVKGLKGLPQSELDIAAQAAKDAGKEGYLFTINRTCLYPFLTYCENRDLRKKLYMGYVMKADNDNAQDNKDIVKKTMALRQERAKLLGYNTPADYVLEDQMAKNADNVYDLLKEVWDAAIPAAKAEVAEMQKIVDKERGHFKIKAWDWWYYAEKVRKAKYDLSEEELKPFFQLENVREGIFTLANKLFGITFTERPDIDVYAEGVKAYEVKEADGTTVAIFYTDYYQRPSKKFGAWMTSYRKEQYIDGKRVLPIIINVCNFPKPNGDMPSLLTFDQVTTAFHEFGHGLHGMLSNCQLHSMSGTDVPRDFVEFPSQILENFASQPEMLKLYAKHYKTGEVMPQELIDKVVKASKFNQGFATTEYVAASLLDMDYHTQTTPIENVNAFEKTSMDNWGLIPEIAPRYRSTYFSHVFSGGYFAGYYSYLWAEVLDADGFNAFKENGIFDQETAKRYRDNILAKGNSDDLMKLYINFRGAAPTTDALLERRGLK